MTGINGLYNRIVKRGMDIIIASVILTVCSPLMALIAVLVRLDSSGPAIFRQQRLGLHGNTFEMYKFRTMKLNSEHTGTGVYSRRDDPRLTRVGKILRATSMDELPQCINILKGEMSFIGPRPPLTYHPWPLEEYTPVQRHMFDVRPGITGWAQIHGRKDVEWNRRIRLNLWYVRYVSFPVDLYIFWNTVLQVASNTDNENRRKTVRNTTAAGKDKRAE